MTLYLDSAMESQDGKTEAKTGVPRIHRDGRTLYEIADEGVPVNRWWATVFFADKKDHEAADAALSLFQASPDLLAALEGMVARWTDDPYCDEAKAARAAVAKARGK